MDPALGLIPDNFHPNLIPWSLCRAGFELQSSRLTLHPDEERACKGQVERDWIQVELRIPMQAEIDGELEDEAANGDGGHGEAIE